METKGEKIICQLCNTLHARVAFMGYNSGPVSLHFPFISGFKNTSFLEEVT